MKTLYVFSNASHYGGAERSLETVLPGLASAFHLVIFAEHPRHVQALEALAIPGASVVALPGGNGFAAWGRALRRVRARLGDAPPDLLLANSNKGALFAGLTRRLVGDGVPAVIYVRDFLWRQRPLIFGLLRDPRILVPSEAVSASPVWAGEFAGFDVSVVPNAVRMPAVPPERPPHPRPYVLCLANLARWKGIDRLVEAFAEVANVFPAVDLIVAGEVNEPDYQREVTARIAALGLDDRIHLRPFADEPGRWLAHARAVVSPSLSRFGGPETFGRTIIEAWSYARPVVAFDCGGPRYLVRHGVDGLLVPEGDCAALAAALGRVLGNPELAARLGREGAVRAAGEFSVAAVSARLGAVLNAALRHPSPVSTSMEVRV